MAIYPQLLSGALAQFPVSRTYSVSNISNVQEDGSRYLATGVDPAWIVWDMRYSGLSASESTSLSQFFQAVRGRLQPFIFADPLGNLLVWSEDLSQAVWQKSAGTVAAVPDSSLGTTWQLSTGKTVIKQTLPCPSATLISFSLLARADNPTSITVAVSDSSGRTQTISVIGNSWCAVTVTQVGTGSDVGKTVEVANLGETPIQVAQFSVCPQPAAGAYRRTELVSGLFANTRFDQDSLQLTATGPNEFNCDVRLTSRLG